MKGRGSLRFKATDDEGFCVIKDRQTDKERYGVEGEKEKAQLQGQKGIEEGGSCM
jgi:hypothetical protein